MGVQEKLLTPYLLKTNLLPQTEGLKGVTKFKTMALKHSKKKHNKMLGIVQ